MFRFSLLLFCLASVFGDSVKDPDAMAFLESKGIDDYQSIVFYKRSNNVSACLRNPDAVERLLLLCNAQSLLQYCLEENRDLQTLDTCNNLQCQGRFTLEHTRCLLNVSGVETLDAENDDGTGCLAEGVRGLSEWSTPPFALAVGDTNSFYCLSALPSGAKLERRVICDGKDPVIEHRVVFESEAFLRTKEREVRCLGAQSCGLPTIFTGEFVCYEPGERDAAMMYGMSLAAVAVLLATFLLI